MSSFVRIDTNSRKEANPTYVSYAILHCESLQLLRYLFFLLFHFPSPSGFSHSIPPRSDVYKGSCYFKRSIQYRIGENGWVTGRRVELLKVVTSRLQRGYGCVVTSNLSLFFYLNRDLLHF